MNSNIKEKIKIIFIYPDDTRHEFFGNEGETVLQVAHKNGVPIEGACEGSLSCSTCHVIVEPGCFCGSLAQKSVEEEDMLDLASGVKNTSRLSCQIKLDETMDGIIFYVPEDSRNYLPNK